MARIIGIAGSTRAGSLNAALLRAAAAAAPAGSTIEIASIRGIPLYDGDLEEQQGVPAPVTALKEMIASGDGLLLATPEYNNSLPGVLKNAIDWLTRPPDDMPRVFRGRPIAVIGATPGQGGTRLSQTAWLPVLRTLGTRPFFERTIYLAGADDLIGGSGELEDPRTLERVGAFVSAFVAFIDGAGR
jgi:NAD(P)H-dependent FMN reductase